MTVAAIESEGFRNAITTVANTGVVQQNHLAILCDDLHKKRIQCVHAAAVVGHKDKRIL
jgi:hypothetical protein